MTGLEASPIERRRLLELCDVSVAYGNGRRATTVIHGVDLHIDAGETLGLIGESGSGKTTIGRAIVGLAPISGGTVRFEGEDITHARGDARRRLATRLQYVFQDPYSSLNPAMKVGRLLADSPAATKLSPIEREARVAAVLERVGLTTDAARRYPRSFSGGQRQRIAIARALIGQPSLIICDEATSALDLSIQAQILNLLKRLQNELGVSYLFIGHNLDVVTYMSHRTAVLRNGRIVEQGDARSVAASPTQSYTQTLVGSVLSPDPRVQAQRRAIAAARRFESPAG